MDLLKNLGKYDSKKPSIYQSNYSKEGYSKDIPKITPSSSSQIDIPAREGVKTWAETITQPVQLQKQVERGENSEEKYSEQPSSRLRACHSENNRKGTEIEETVDKERERLTFSSSSFVDGFDDPQEEKSRLLWGGGRTREGRKIWLPIHSIAPRISNQFPRSIANHKEAEIPGCRPGNEILPAIPFTNLPQKLAASYQIFSRGVTLLFLGTLPSSKGYPLFLPLYIIYI